MLFFNLPENRPGPGRTQPGPGMTRLADSPVDTRAGGCHHITATTGRRAGKTHRTDQNHSQPRPQSSRQHRRFLVEIRENLTIFRCLSNPRRAAELIVPGNHVTSLTTSQSANQAATQHQDIVGLGHVPQSPGASLAVSQKCNPASPRPGRLGCTSGAQSRLLRQSVFWQ